MTRPRTLAVRIAFLGLAIPGAVLALQAQTTAPPAAPPAGAAGPQPGVDLVKDRDAVFDAFYRTDLDTSTAYAVTNLTLRKDTMTLLFKQGTMFLMKPIGGEVTGAAFVGDGEASMTPPNRAVRFMLNKYSGAETLKEPFTEAVLRFSDGTDKLILTQSRPDPAGAAQAERAKGIFQDRNAWLDGTRTLHFETEFLEARLSGAPGLGFFVTDFHTLKHDWLSYIHSSLVPHENNLVASATLGTKGRRYLIPWATWHRQSDYDASGRYVLNPDRDAPRVLRIEHTDLSINLPNTKTVEWEARQTITPLVDTLRCLRLDLVNNAQGDSRWSDEAFWPVKVVSVADETGAALPFQHKKDQLLVVLPKPARFGASLTLVTKGTADVIYQLTAESFGLLEAPWYPQYGYLGGRSTFDWTVRVPRPFLLTGSGRIVREFEDKEKNQNGIEMKSDVPVNFPWVIFGRFQKTQTDYVGEESKKTVSLTVHSFPTMTISITDSEELEELGASQPVTYTLSAPADKVKGILSEMKEVLKLFENLYGPFPYDELHIAQMGPQLRFSQAPPGFVQLTGLAFLSQAQLESDFVHGMCAHEAAHQWWGNQVGWASGDDEWLSEGFAEYASGIFVNEYQGPKRFQRTLQEWKRAARIGDKEAPIVAAHLLSGPNAGDYRTDLIYNKAPYVLHMLRVQLNDKKYVEVMRAVQETYKGRNISTEMLLAQINKTTGQDYTFFFDQWIWGTGIPTFRYTWRSEKQPEGKYLITVHVSQDDKANVKKVTMPVHIHFKDKTIPSYQPVVQVEQDIKIMSPAEPKDVTLDDDHTLLADIVKAG